MFIGILVNNQTVSTAYKLYKILQKQNLHTQTHKKQWDTYSKYTVQILTKAFLLLNVTYNGVFFDF